MSSRVETIKVPKQDHYSYVDYYKIPDNTTIMTIPLYSYDSIYQTNTNRCVKLNPTALSIETTTLFEFYGGADAIIDIYLGTVKLARIHAVFSAPTINGTTSVNDYNELLPVDPTLYNYIRHSSGWVSYWGFNFIVVTCSYIGFGDRIFYKYAVAIKRSVGADEGITYSDTSGLGLRVVAVSNVYTDFRDHPEQTAGPTTVDSVVNYPEITLNNMV